jgi:hypothetical protein
VSPRGAGRSVWVAVVLLLGVSAGEGAAQRAADVTRELPARSAAMLVSDADTGRGGMQRPWLAPVASLAVPGLGQAILGENRALAYVVTEVYALLEFHAWRTEGRRRRAEYRRVAADVARAAFGESPPVGPFSYYEAMRTFVSSGAFDRVPGGTLEPEVDETTFNGRLWRLARETYWADPSRAPDEGSVAYRNAVGMYIRRAVQPEYAWSWRDAALEHDLYRLTIQRSNTAFRRSQDFAGVLLANHLLSMVDALVTVQLRLPAQP